MKEVGVQGLEGTRWGDGDGGGEEEKDVAG